MAPLLQKHLDAHQWEAEDVVGRLGMVLHAAFLFAGFRPYGAKPPSGYLLKHPGESTRSRCLSRWYTAPQLARREDADAAVLMLSAQGSHVALLIFLTTGNVLGSAYRERLDVAVLKPVLSRAMDATEPWGSRICRSLGNGVCWRFLHELCRGNGLPLTGFTSLPDDAMVEILKRLVDGADIAKVQCTSRQLRSLVAADINRELWEPLCEWFAQRLLKVLPPTTNIMFSTDFFFSPVFQTSIGANRAEQKASLALIRPPPRRAMDSPAPPIPFPPSGARDDEGRSAKWQPYRNVPRNNKKKSEDAGIARLPCSRYRRNHR